MKRLAKGAVGTLLALVLALSLAFAFAIVVTARRGDSSLFPAQPGAGGLSVLVVNNGYHSGLVVPRSALAEIARRGGHAALGVVAGRFSAYENLELGWGEARFYREVPTIDRLNWRLALSALFGRDNESVLHVVGIEGDPRDVFRGAEIVPVRVSAEGAARLFARLEATFAPKEGGLPEELGPGLYGPSLFYRARGSFNILNVCNHWIADLLDAAGVPTSPVLATLPSGLVLDLRWRSGLMPERP